MKKPKKIIIASLLVILIGILVFLYVRGQNFYVKSDSNKAQQEDKNSNGSNTSDNGNINEVDSNSKNSNKVENVEPQLPEYNPAKSEDEAKNTIKKLVSVLYFKNGSYDDYKVLFTDSEKAMNETKFNEFRKSHTAKDKFKYDPESVESIMKHMKTVKTDKDITVYYLEDISDTKEMQSAIKWILVEKDNKTLIMNDGIR